MVDIKIVCACERRQLAIRYFTGFTGCAEKSTSGQYDTTKKKKKKKKKKSRPFTIPGDI